jgi:hypothetical protein
MGNLLMFAKIARFGAGSVHIRRQFLIAGFHRKVVFQGHAGPPDGAVILGLIALLTRPGRG